MKQYPNAFNEDTILQETFLKLVERTRPDMIIETGTHQADTTEFLASFNIPVVTTEIDYKFYNLSKKRLEYLNNVVQLLGDSADQLSKILDNTLMDKKIIMFLDSHFNNDQVLERELELFVKLTIKPIIIIHDFYVPGKDFGYDTWDGHRYDFDFYKSYFDNIYGMNGYSYKFNDDAVGKRRGVIIVEPLISWNH